LPVDARQSIAYQLCIAKKGMVMTKTDAIPRIGSAMQRSLFEPGAADILNSTATFTLVP
jgi:hypothetical protein